LCNSSKIDKILRSKLAKVFAIGVGPGSPKYVTEIVKEIVENCDVIIGRQVVNFIKSKNTMIRHDGYNEEELVEDVKDERNVELAFDDISSISFEDKTWGGVLQLEYTKNDKEEKFQYSIAQDWVKYPAKEPTKYMKVDWEPFVQFIKDRQNFTK